MSFYLFILILCAKILCVTWALKGYSKVGEGKFQQKFKSNVNNIFAYFCYEMSHKEMSQIRLCFPRYLEVKVEHYALFTFSPKN